MPAAFKACRREGGGGYAEKPTTWISAFAGVTYFELIRDILKI
jgi:hypothetical protein